MGRLKVKMENVCYLNSKHIKTKGAIMISDKVNFKAKIIIRKNRHFVIIKRLTY